MGRIYIYETKLKENLNICVLNCLSISKSHGCPVRVVYNGIELVIDRKVDSRKAFWVEMYQTKLNNKKAPFTPVGDNLQGIGMECYQCSGEWSKCKHTAPPPPLPPLPPTPPTLRAIKENGRPPTTEYVAKKKAKPKGFGTERSKTPFTPVEEDGSTEARKLDDKCNWFFFGCFIGLLSSYCMVNL